MRIRSDEGLTLETSASESLYGGQFTLSTQLIKPTYLTIYHMARHMRGAVTRINQSECLIIGINI